MSMSVLCHCACNSDAHHASMLGSHEGEVRKLAEGSPIGGMGQSKQCGLVSYTVDLEAPLQGPATRCGDVWHLVPEEGKSFEKATLTLYQNGVLIRHASGRKPISLAWSPFSLVQACRLHSTQADQAMPWLRLFKISIFQFGATHFFAPRDDDADVQRAQWVADIARSLRVMTQSLFPEFNVTSMPMQGANWTALRLLAGYLLLCDDRGVSLVYCELHSHWDCAAMFAAYENSECDTLVVRLGVDMNTSVSERVGVDCSCFSFDGYHFTTRTCSEKMLWLRTISNLKVKLRHRAPNPTPDELEHYRASILECAKTLQPTDNEVRPSALLPRRPLRRVGTPSRTASDTGTPRKNAEADRWAGHERSHGNNASSTPESSAMRLQQLPSPHKLALLTEGFQQGTDEPTYAWPEVPAMPTSPMLDSPVTPMAPASLIAGPAPVVPITVSFMEDDAEELFAESGSLGAAVAADVEPFDSGTQPKRCSAQ
mmetsp:Transcript_45088/g.124984  ORF Transcript_45088/g.124984 Transcript_45088/m.124984 type:complete len:484 (-) Transcript_45088:162-1613(-)